MSANPLPDEFEAMLRATPLRPPTSRLDALVRARLSRQSTAVWLKWAAVSAAAIIVLAITVIPAVVRHTPSHPLSQAINHPATHPVAGTPPPPLWVESRQVRIKDDGVVGFASGVPLQRFRRQTLRQIWVIDPARSTRVSVSIPQEQVVVLPLHAF